MEDYFTGIPCVEAIIILDQEHMDIPTFKASLSNAGI